MLIKLALLFVTSPDYREGSELTPTGLVRLTPRLMAWARRGHATAGRANAHVRRAVVLRTLRCYDPGVLTTSLMFRRLTPLNGFGALSIVPVPVAFA